MANDIEPSDSQALRTRIVQQRRLAAPQFSLLTLLLLVTAFAVWVAYFNNQGAIPGLQARINGVRPFVRELYVDDKSQIAVVKLEELLHGDNRWQVYLPQESRYRLYLATRDVPDIPPNFGKGKTPGVTHIANAPYFPSRFVQCDLSSGVHTIELESESAADLTQLLVGNLKTCVTEKGQVLLEIEEPSSWKLGDFSNDGHLGESCQYAPDRPVILRRVNFWKPKAGFNFDWNPDPRSNPPGPSNGILLWIEKIKD